MGFAENRYSRGQVLKTFVFGLLVAGPLGTIWKVPSATAAPACSNTDLQNCLEENKKTIDSYIKEVCKPTADATSGDRYRSGAALFAVSCTAVAEWVHRPAGEEKCVEKHGCPDIGTVCCGGQCCNATKCCGDLLCCGSGKACLNGQCVDSNKCPPNPDGSFEFCDLEVSQCCAHPITGVYQCCPKGSTCCHSQTTDMFGVGSTLCCAPTDVCGHINGRVGCFSP
jgi:hypothetical protein